MVTALIIVLAGTGAVIASYFTLVTAGAVHPDARWLPRVCRMERSACSAIVNDPDAALFGVPNAVLALGLHAAVLAAALSPGSPVLREGVRVALWAAVAGGLYLTGSLLIRLKVRCLLCLVSHAITLSLALLFSLAGPEPA